MSSPERKYENLPLYVLGDEPIRSWENDRLGISPYADVIVGAALGNPGPFTIGVFGDWGQGKTSVLRAAESRLKAPSVDKSAPPVVPVWFNAWRFEREAQPIVPLVATIQRAVLRKVAEDKGFWERLGEGGQEFLRRLVAGGAQLLSAVKLSGSAEAGIVGIGKLGGKIDIEGERVVKAMEKLFTSSPSMDTSALGRAIENCIPLSAFDRLESLTDGDRGRTPRIVVFIDDLDRCEPDKAFDLLEAVKVVLAQPGFIFVLALNKTIVDSYVETLWKKRLMDRHSNEATRYLDKIVQLPLYLRSHEREFQGFVDHILDKTLEGKLAKETLDVLRGVRGHLGRATRFGPRTLIRRVNTILVDQRLRPKPNSSDPKVVKDLTDGQFLGLCLVQRTLGDELDAQQLNFLSEDDEVCRILGSKSLDAAYDHFRVEAASTSSPGGPPGSGGQQPVSRRASARVSEALTLILRIESSESATYVLETEFGKLWLSSAQLRELVRDFVSSRSSVAQEDMQPGVAPMEAPESVPREVQRTEFPAGSKAPGIPLDGKALTSQRAILERAVRRSLNLDVQEPLTRESWSKVESLAFVGEPVDDRCAALVAARSTGLGALKDLDFSFTVITDTGLKALTSKETGLRNVMHLSLWGTAITDEGVKALASKETGLGNLTHLNLGFGAMITDGSLNALASKDTGVGKLTDLILTGTGITDEGLRVLASKKTGLAGLTRLYLSSTAITDKGVKALASKETGLGNLTELTLGFCEGITDESLNTLASKDTGIRGLASLDLSGTKTTDKGVASLCQARPNVTIVRHV